MLRPFAPSWLSYQLVAVLGKDVLQRAIAIVVGRNIRALVPVHDVPCDRERAADAIDQEDEQPHLGGAMEQWKRPQDMFKIGKGKWVWKKQTRENIYHGARCSSGFL